MQAYIHGSFAPKTPNMEVVKQAPHSEQATGQGMHCRETLLTPRCSPRAREFPRSGQLFCTTYGCAAASYGASKLSNFRILVYSPHKKNPKKYLPVTSLYSPGVHHRMIPIFPCDSRRSKGVPSGSGVFLRLLVGELQCGPSSLSKFSLTVNGYTHTECY